MTGVVRVFLKQCVGQVDEETVVRQVKGPHFFGLRTATLNSKLDTSVFPGDADAEFSHFCF